VPEGVIVAMVKPQFEADKHVTDDTKGIIPTEGMRTAILKDFERNIADEFTIEASADSKVSGMKGNVERFYKMRVKQPQLSS
jgi:predicted rRNA methylase YqxC with S4 and FtsJ domains